MLQYMLDNDINNWIHYYAYTFIIPVAKGEENEAINDLSELYAFVLTGYILDTFREKRIDIKNLVEGQVLAHKTNQYDLTVVDGVEFKRDYFVFEGKAYLYSILTNTNTMRFGDTMQAFVRIITEQVKDGNILLRLDERLVLPINQAISYSTLNLNWRHFHTEFYLGRKFRHLICAGTHNIRLITVGNEESAINVLPNDPLFLMVPNRVSLTEIRDIYSETKCYLWLKYVLTDLNIPSESG